MESSESLMFSQFRLGLDIHDADDPSDDIDEYHLSTGNTQMSIASCPTSPFPGVRMTPRSYVVPELNLTPSSHAAHHGGGQQQINSAPSHASFSFGSNMLDGSSVTKEFSVHPSLFVHNHMPAHHHQPLRHRSTPAVPVFQLDAPASAHEVTEDNSMPSFNGFMSDFSMDYNEDHGR
jgi:hypothetical protein